MHTDKWFIASLAQGHPEIKYKHLKCLWQIDIAMTAKYVILDQPVWVLLSLCDDSGVAQIAF